MREAFSIGVVGRCGVSYREVTFQWAPRVGILGGPGGLRAKELIECKNP